MRKIIILCFVFIFFTGCNDGDVLDVQLEFDQELEFCDQSNTTYLLYDINLDPFESLSLTFPITTTNALIFNPTENPYTSTLVINGSTVRFNYRTYDGNPENLLCALVPDPDTTIINDYESTSGTVTTVTLFTDDDEDGIPTNIEDLNLDGDNDPETNPTDTDGDGIPNYKDADDDNDNILTKFENPNYTEAFGLLNAQDTDGDGVPDYLDNDDDGDSILTRYEDENLDNNPRNDFDEASITPDVPRYLDASTTATFVNDTLVPNTYKRTFVVTFTLTEIDLQILSTEMLFLGDYIYSVIIE